MVCVRGLVLFLLCLAGAARRSMRVTGFSQDAQGQHNTLANDLDVSAEAQEGLIPKIFGTRVSRRVGTQTGASSKLSKYGAAPPPRSSPGRAKEIQMAMRDVLHTAGADVNAEQIEDAMWSLQHMLRDLADNPEKISKTLKGSPASGDLEQAALIDDPEQQEKDVNMMKEMARLVENTLEKDVRDEGKMQAFATQMKQVLKRAHELMHNSELTKLLDQVQLVAEADAPAHYMNRGAPRTVPATMNEGGDMQDGAGIADLKELAKELNPAIGYWDPLNLAELEPIEGETQESWIGFLRQAEIKHGRVAMAAFVGYIVQANGIHFPWKTTLGGITYGDIAAAGGPADQWDALPTAAKLQIILFVGFLEWWSENSFVLAASGQAHYMRGGKPGAFPSLKTKVPGAVRGVVPSLKKDIPHPVPFDLFDPFNLQKGKSDEWKSKKLLAEINNGRLAMLGIMAFLAESKVPGAVPLLSGLGIKPYAGEVMAPFAAGDVSLPFVNDMLGLNLFS